MSHAGSPPFPWRRSRPRRPPGTTAVAVLLCCLSLLAGFAAPAKAAIYVAISGAGSTWSQNAIDQWRREVTKYGMQVNYAGTGSSDGRNQFRNGTVDFAATEIPYGTTENGVVEPPPSRGFAYIPDVAGGTTFMYNLHVGSRQVTNLRLSGKVIAEIFTGVITKWNDPAIAADNPGLVLPAEQITPVVRSDGSGTTAQFTLWMSDQQPDLWNAYCARAGRKSNPCGETSYFPLVNGSATTAQSGSLGVAGFVSQAQNEGTIGYVEYSYALNTGFPIAKMLNAGGYYTEPTPSNVAVALLKAQVDTTDVNNPALYLTQQLHGVYVDTDPRTYPLSSYSYMIIPTRLESGFTTDKGRTLGAFANWFLCQGQQEASVLGYSPLPINLAQAGLDQVRKIPGVDPATVNIATCNNPTFSSDGTNLLADTAPYPSPCDRIGVLQCNTGTGGAKSKTTPTLRQGAPPAAGAGAAGSGGTAQGGAGAGPAGAASATAAGGNPIDGGSAVVPAGGAASSADASSDGAADVIAVPVATSSRNGTALQHAVMVLVGVALLVATVAPPAVSRRLRRRRDPR